MELEETILSEVTQSQKDKHGMYWLIYRLLDIEQRITSLQSTTPEKLGSKEGPKGDIHGSTEKRKGTSSPE